MIKRHIHNSPGSPLRLALCFQRWQEHGTGSLVLPLPHLPLLHAGGGDPPVSGPPWEGGFRAACVPGTPHKGWKRDTSSPGSLQDTSSQERDADRFQADPPALTLDFYPHPHPCSLSRACFFTPCLTSPNPSRLFLFSLPTIYWD